MHRLRRQLFLVPALAIGSAAALLLLSIWQVIAAEQSSLPMVSTTTVGLPENSISAPGAQSPESIPAPQATGNTPPEAVNATPTPPQSTTTPELPTQAPEYSSLLNDAQLFALGMIESGNNDNAVGGLGEVSRFQIMPSVWKHYSASRNYRNVDVASYVAKQHWTALYDYFKSKTDREPTDFDMYVLWNTRYGYYAGKSFSPAQLHPIVRDRAQRFANLVEDRDNSRRASQLAMAATR